ncbi:MAG: hypothetical protein HZA90_24425 [Verrucomicrobia bacterium]|nr:hypothetical protein [Verrucomicrobiota bacterium]
MAGTAARRFGCGLAGLRSLAAIVLLVAFAAKAQTLLNLDFGVGTASAKSGLAATGMTTNDFWNLYAHYSPRLTPGMTPVPDGRRDGLKLSDGTPMSVSVSVSNAPGVWGNTSGDPMFDTYLFAPNGSNITVAISGLEAGRYHFYLYSHADADVTGPQASVFTLRIGTNVFGPLPSLGAAGWRTNQPWIERNQFVLFRDVPVEAGKPVLIEAAPGVNGVAVLNGIQILSRGTSPPKLPSALVKAAGPTNPPPYAATNVLIHEVRYQGKVSDTEARFHVTAQLETESTNTLAVPLFSGDVALVVPELPEGLRIVSSANQYRLLVTAPGRYALALDLVAKITKAEPWNQINFTGPPAAIAYVNAEAAAPDVEMQLLSGLQSDGEQKATSKLGGVLGADRVLSMRWQGKATEITRKSLVTADTTATATVSPSVIRFTTQFRLEILQAPLPKLVIGLPANQTLTKVQGDQIRDWRLDVGQASRLSPSNQVLTLDFLKPVEKSYTLTLHTEQTIESTPATATLVPPAPSEVERESGSFTVSADDTLVEIDSAPGLRQVNATGGALAAYRFNGRPVSISARLRRIEPVLKLADRVTARLEETRLLVSHALNLTVEKAGLYALELTPQPGFVVSEVKGEALDDWKVSDGKLRVSFASRVLGTRKIDVQLEQAHKQFPETITVLPLVVAGATNVTAQVGAASSAGIRVKTGELTNLREVPVAALSRGAGGAPVSDSRRMETGATPVPLSDETLAFVSEQPDWKLTLAAEKLSARVIAEVFNLVTIGDGLVGGSATVRYGIFNQGVQEFRVQLPAHWKNVEFTGANIRRKEQTAGRGSNAERRAPDATLDTRPSTLDTNSAVWTISLQDKAWAGYTLVITYDYQFDPKGATLDLAGARPLDVERETGSLGLMTAASLKLTPAAPALPLRRVDESELSESDRALCTRPLLLAYRYAGTSYAQTVQVSRFEEVPVLDAVADRIELTTVVTEQGQMLTQAGFMVKNNEKQFQQFKLPPGAEFWSSYVNGQPAKPERNGDWFLVPLPRDANRDQAFAVDIVYAQKIDLQKSLLPRRVALAAPVTDIPNTYAEWQLFVPVSQRLSGFDGNMTVARGTTYELRDAWEEFVQFYGNFIERNGGLILFCCVIGLLALLVVAAVRRGFQGAVTVLVLVGVLAVLAGMMLPALSKAKAKATRIQGVSNLKQIGLAAQLWAHDNGGYLPASFDVMTNELGSEKVLRDPSTGQRFVYVGAGKRADDVSAIVAYSPSDVNGRSVVFADGSVQMMTAEKFQEALQRDAVVPRAVFSANQPASQSSTVAPMEQSPQFMSPAPAAPGRPMGGLVGGGAPMTATASAAPAPAQPQAKPTAAGVRSIHIDVPRTGQAFNFTKVLNAGREPLSVSVSMMRMKVYRQAMMVVQVCGFLIGLVMLWAFASRTARSSFWLTVALALVIASVSSLLYIWRLLGTGLIVLLPLLLIILMAWAARQWWLRRAVGQASRLSPSSPPPLDSAPSAGAAAIVFLLGFTSSLFADTQFSSSASASNAVTLVSANYNGAVREKVAQFDAAIQISSVTTNQLVPLFADDVAVQSFTNSADASLVRQGRSVSVWLPSRTNVTLHLKLLARLGGDVSKRTLAFGIPPALASRVSVSIDEADADVESPTAVALQRASTNQQTRVEAILGAGDRLEMHWTPRVKRAAEIAATVFVQNAALVTLGNGVMNVRATLDYQISQGELKQARVALPAGQRLLRVEGEFIRTWEIKVGQASRLSPSSPPGAEEEILVVDLLKGVSPAYKLTVETEKVLEKLPATAKVEVPHALDVKRETGLVGVRGSEELSLAVEDAKELQRVDAEEFHRAAPDKKDGLFSAFRFLKTDFALRVRAEAIQPQIEAVVRNNVRIGAESVRLTAQVDYTIKRAGIFSLRLALPAGWRLDSVSGNNVLQWAERDDAGRRLVDVALKERTLGSYALTLTLAQSYREPPKTLAIAGVHPLDTEKLSGFITVTTDLGIAAKTESFDGLTEVPFAAGSSSTVSGGSALAYKFIATTPTPQAAWKLNVATEAVEPWVRAEIANIVTLTETLVSGRTLIKYDVANAPVREFRVRVPAAFKNVEITGANIRRRDETNGEWRVELQGKVRGDYVLTVTWEVPKSEKTNLVELTGVQALAVERETGWLSLIARPPLQVAERGASELLSKIDVRELPEWLGRADAATVLAYRYLRPGYKLAVEARRFDAAEVLEALIDSARLTTVVADDGQMMTEISLSIRNHGRQHLEIELPLGATVWSAFVAGEPVRPSRREGKFLLPLERSVASDAPIAIELTFIGADKFPKRRGEVALASPKFDVPLKNARWDLYLPPDYDYGAFEGTMSRTADTGTPLVQVYSLAEYNVQQRAQEEQKKEDVKSELKSARENIKGTNLRQAITSYNRAKTKSSQVQQEVDEARSLKEIEKEVREVQGRNLIMAQNAYFLDNNARLGGQQVPMQVLNASAQGAEQQQARQPGPTAQPQMFLNYDAEVAGQQWDKLEKAQQVAVAKVAPLRVNLPTRGVRLAFSQVLQTEVRKPMTIRLVAENAKAPSWITRIGLAGLGFVALWGIVGLSVARRER